MTIVLTLGLCAPLLHNLYFVMLLIVLRIFVKFVCISPRSIPNPNYGRYFLPGDPLSFKDCSSKELRIPCGHCEECIAVKQMALVQRVQMESLSNYLFFATLTYNRASLPSITTSSGFDIKYADYSDFQKCMKRLRKREAFSRPFRYFVVTERGGQNGRPHIHAIFIVPKYRTDDIYTPGNLEKLMWSELLFEWRRNISKSTKKPIWQNLCTYQAIYKHGILYRNYDLHYIRPYIDDDGFSNVAFYVLKYMLKPSDKETRLQQALRLNLSSGEYETVWNMVRSKYHCSKMFGLSPTPFGDIDDSILSHLRESIEMSKDFAKYFNPSSGASFPLSRYYKSRPEIYTMDDATRFYFESDSPYLDSPPDYSSTDRDYAQLLDSERRLRAKINAVFDRGDFDSNLYLFD